jgi:hypothetical protein
MTAKISICMVCDSCQKHHPPWGANDSVQKAREAMLLEGWWFHLSFGDLCERCIPEAQRMKAKTDQDLAKLRAGITPKGPRR